MKKVLFVHSSAEMYGSDKSLLNIVNNIDYEKFDINVILPCEGPLLDKMKLNSKIKVSIYDVAVLRRKNLSLIGILSYIKQFCKSYKFIKKYIRENDIDIVYTNTSVVFPGAIAAKSVGIKSVWHIREIIKKRLENRIISRIVNHYADIVIANSKATANSILVDKEKVKVVYNSVDEFEIAKNRKKNKDENFVIGMAGRINRWKGQKLFIEVADIVLKKYPKTKFLIAGSSYSGEEYLEDELKEIINNKKINDSIKLLGQVNNMKEFYENIDIFVLPSIQPEPFGLVVIEAMDAGVPVIATNHGGPIEIIENGKDGYLVDFNKPNEMAEKIILLEENPQLVEEIIRNANLKKKTKFSIEAMVKNISDILIKM